MNAVRGRGFAPVCTTTVAVSGTSRSWSGLGEGTLPRYGSPGGSGIAALCDSDLLATCHMSRCRPVFAVKGRASASRRNSSRRSVITGRMAVQATVRAFADGHGWPLDQVGVAVRFDPQGQIVRNVRLTGDLQPAHMTQLLAVAGRCPVHRLLTREVSIVTVPTVLARPHVSQSQTPPQCVLAQCCGTSLRRRRPRPGRRGAAR